MKRLWHRCWAVSGCPRKHKTILPGPDECPGTACGPAPTDPFVLRGVVTAPGRPESLSTPSSSHPKGRSPERSDREA